jgi:hypothetical protein
VYPTIIARQRLCKNFTAATITYVTIEELLDALLSVQSVLYQMKVDYFSSQNFWFYTESINCSEMKRIREAPLSAYKTN